MEKLIKILLSYKKSFITLIVILTTFLGWFGLNIKIYDNVLDYFPKDNEKIKIFKEVDNKFKGTDVFLVAIETQDIFQYKFLSKIKLLVELYKEIEGVAHVISLADILNISEEEGKGIEITPILNYIPNEIDKLEELKKKVLNDPLAVGSFISEEGDTSLIICYLSNKVDPKKTALKIREITLSNKEEEKYFFAGVPFINAYMEQASKKDMIQIIPLITLVIFLLLYLCFRSIKGVIITLLVVIISIIWTLGIISLVGFHLTMPTSSIPIILFAIGTTFSIYFLKTFQSVEEKSFDERIKKTLQIIFYPLLYAMVASFIGLISFRFINLNPVKELGTFSAIGIFFSFLLSVTLLPIILSFIEFKNLKRDILREDFLELILDNKKIIFIITGCLVISAIIIFPFIESGTTISSFFEEGSEPKEADDLMVKKFGGTLFLQVRIDGDLYDPFFLRSLEKIETFFSSQEEVKEVKGITSAIKKVNNLMTGNDFIPTSSGKLKNLWFFLEGETSISSLVSGDMKSTLLHIKLEALDSFKIRKIIKKGEEFFKNLKGGFRKIPTSESFHEIQANDIAYEIESKLKQLGIVIDRENLKNIIYDFTQKLPTLNLDEEEKRIVIEKISSYLLGNESLILFDKNGLEKFLNKAYPLLTNFKIDDKSFINLLKEENLNIDEEDYKTIAEIFINQHDTIINNIKILKILDEILKLIKVDDNKKERVKSQIKPSLYKIYDDYILVENNSNFKEIGELIPIKSQLTGFPVLFTIIEDNVKVGHIKSLVFTILLIFLIFSLKFKSLKGGVISLISVFVTLIIHFGIMGIFQVPLDMGTIMITSITLGIGVSYSILFILIYMENIKHVKNVKDSIIISYKKSFPLIFWSASLVSIVFLILTFSSLLPIRRLGGFTAEAVALSAIFTILLLPNLINFSKRL